MTDPHPPLILSGELIHAGATSPKSPLGGWVPIQKLQKYRSQSSPPKIRGWGSIVHLGQVGQNIENWILGNGQLLKRPQKSEFATREIGSFRSLQNDPTKSTLYEFLN